MTDTFAMRWFGLDGLKNKAPDTTAYPNYKASLKAAFETETRTFFENILSKNLNMSDLVKADYTFVNQELAAHYGLPAVSGTQFRQVSLASTPRRGIVSQEAC